MASSSPSAAGLVSETENTQPPSQSTNHISSSHSAPKLDLDQKASQIKLPYGQKVGRPIVPANKSLYERLPPHLVLADGTPNYLPMLLTSSVYNILPPSGTALTPAVSLSSRLGNKLFFKREDLTPVFSFKVRGAFNLMSQLTSDERWRGVIACSAGNHAQGVALSGQQLGIACTIVMPLNTPSIKYLNVARLGAKVVLHGADFDEAKRECNRLAKVHGLTNIPPFDDPYVLAGQGTCGVEILKQIQNINELDAIFVPVGGGGLLAGILAYIKKVAPPHVKVIGVETFDADCLYQSLKEARRLTLNEVGLFADGTAVRLMGEETFRLCAEMVDEIILVSNDEICAAVKDVFEDTRSVSEPSGALAVAGMKRYITDNNLLGKGKQFVSIVSGANINFSRLRFIAERAEIGEGKEATLRVVIPEKPGSFLALHACIHPRAVTEFIYRYSSSKKAYIFLSFHLSTPSAPSASSSTAATAGTSTPIPTPQQLRAEELSTIMSSLKNKGMKPLDLSDNEMAKAHARYLVGGKNKVRDERMFRFEFPERPGALRKFLESLPEGFNISLFHYRNHGGDVGKILCGIQVPENQSSELDGWLQQLSYPFVEETSNPVYHDFLNDEESDEE